MGKTRGLRQLQRFRKSGERPLVDYRPVFVSHFPEREIMQKTNLHQL